MKITTKLLKAEKIGTKAIKIRFQLMFSELTYDIRKLLLIVYEEDNLYYGIEKCQQCGRCCLAYKNGCAKINLVNNKCKLYGTSKFPKECKDYFCVEDELMPVVKTTDTMEFCEHIPYMKLDKAKTIIQERIKKRKDEYFRRLNEIVRTDITVEVNKSLK